MYLYILVMLSLAASSTYANEKCNANDLLSFYTYIKKNSPVLKEVQKQKLEIASKVDIAKQRPNPEINIDYLRGTQLGQDVNNYTLSAKHIIELGSKRDKRIEKSHSYKKLNENKVDLSFYQQSSDAIIKYQRVAQLEIVIRVVKEAIHTFDIVIKRLSNRKSLNPEETVSLSTLRLASSDYKAQLNDLENEKTILEGEISFLSDCDSLNIKYKSFDFKKLSLESKMSNSLGLLELEDFKVDLAKKEYEVQKSLGYSNIAIGPSIEYQKQGSENFSSTGISISFSLPLFHTNDGGKLDALRALNKQSVQSKNTKRNLTILRKQLVRKFDRSLKTLLVMPSLDEIERKHTKVEKLFSRGVVSTQMTIESHRQQVDFLKSRFETENDVLETIGKISLIDGNLQAFEMLL